MLPLSGVRHFISRSDHVTATNDRSPVEAGDGSALGRRRQGEYQHTSHRTYDVNITSLAERDVAKLYGEITAGHSDAALKCYRGLREAILTLKEQPNRCPVARKNDGLRHLLYGHKPHIYWA